MSLMSKESPRLVLNTLLASAAAATVIGLTGCSPAPEEPKVAANTYRNVAECMADGHASNLCSSALTEAKAEAKKVTPTYESKKDCEDDWGSSNCADTETALAAASEDFKTDGMDALASTAAPATTTHAGGGGFSPFFWGYMMGSNGSHSYSQPVYRGGSDHSPRLASGFAVPAGRSAVPASAFNKAGASHFATGSSNSAKAAAAATAAKSTSVKSGGFGSVGRAGGFSSGG